MDAGPQITLLPLAILIGDQRFTRSIS